MNYAGLRKIWFAISLLLIIPGLISMAIHYPKPLNFGIDFTGGTILNLEFAKEASISEVRDVLKEFGRQNSTILESGDKGMIIKTEFMQTTERDEVVAKLQEELGSVKVTGEDNVGPVIGKELAIKALLALALASVLMVLYITFRFEFKFAIAGIIALLHDVLLTIGLFSIFRWEVDSSFVAAILTIIGYSINDTIVIFDRIRENLNKRRQNESLEELVNKSISQTITRSINTVLTVLFTLVALYIFGGANIRNFTLAMLIGIISGAYSSIFNASQIWLEMRKWSDKGRATKTA